MSAILALPSTLNRAFKEWAVVCMALERGRQSVLLRKGGLREDDGAFRIDQQQFLLMPTYEHQRPDWLEPEHAPLIADSDVSEPHAASIRISAWAVVARVFRVETDEAAHRLGNLMVTNDVFVQSRLEFNPYDPLYALALRVYRLPEPVWVAASPAYGGCRSWITLDQGIDVRGSVPTLSEAVFDATLRNIESAATSGR